MRKIVFLLVTLVFSASAFAQIYNQNVGKTIYSVTIGHSTYGSINRIIDKSTGIICFSAEAATPESIDLSCLSANTDKYEAGTKKVATIDAGEINVVWDSETKIACGVAQASSSHGISIKCLQK